MNLPAGTDWYNFWTNNRLRGGQTIQVNAPIDQLPVFIRAGSILPLGEAIENTTQTQRIAKVRVYPGANCDFTRYDDDGRTYAYETGGGRVTKLDWDDGARRLRHEGPTAWTGSDLQILEIPGR